MVQKRKLSPWVEEVSVPYHGGPHALQTQTLTCKLCISRSPLVWIDFQECASVSQNQAGKRLLSNEGEKKKTKNKYLPKPSLVNCLYLGRAIPGDTMALVSISEDQWSWSPLVVDVAEAEPCTWRYSRSQQAPRATRPTASITMEPSGTLPGWTRGDSTSLGEMHRAIQHRNRHVKPWLS